MEPRCVCAAQPSGVPPARGRLVLAEREPVGTAAPRRWVGRIIRHRAERGRDLAGIPWPAGADSFWPNGFLVMVPPTLGCPSHPASCAGSSHPKGAELRQTGTLKRLEGKPQ